MNAAARIAYPERIEEEIEANEGLAESIEAQSPSADDEGLPEETTEEEETLSPKELGMKGEEAAARYLELRGYEILHRNWTCRFGEADIIARDDDGTLCFIEVKTRRGIDAGLPEDAITPKKQARYERIALCYLMDDDEWKDNDPVRFDAIGICVSAPHRALLRHHRGCFNGCF